MPSTNADASTDSASSSRRRVDPAGACGSTSWTTSDRGPSTRRQPAIRHSTGTVRPPRRRVRGSRSSCDRGARNGHHESCWRLHGDGLFGHGDLSCRLPARSDFGERLGDHRLFGHGDFGERLGTTGSGPPAPRLRRLLTAGSGGSAGSATSAGGLPRLEPDGGLRDVGAAATGTTGLAARAQRRSQTRSSAVGVTGTPPICSYS